MSRTIFGLALGLSLALACGCGSKSEPPPGVKLDPDAPPAPSGDPNAAPPKVDAVVVWETDQSKHVIPATLVKGRIGGADVTPEVVLEGDELTFRVLKAGAPTVERSVKLKLAPMLVAGQPIPQVTGREWKVKLDEPPGPNVPVVWRETLDKGAHLSPSGYALTLQLGTRKGGKVPGKIYLSLSDDDKTVLAGTFEAAYTRSPTELPGPDDVPYIGGEVTLVGAKPGGEVRIGYAAFTETIVSFPEILIPFTAPPESPSPTRVEMSTYVPGDGATRAFRYEHVKLAPGRYLLTAAVPGGPTVWKWVDVAADTARTENIVIDPTKTGAVEVSVPAGATGPAYLAPADDPAKPAIEPAVFRSFAALVTRQGAEIVAGKATLKNLAPGKYEVRAGDLRGFVDVVAGKTAELALAPPKK